MLLTTLVLSGCGAGQRSNLDASTAANPTAAPVLAPTINPTLPPVTGENSTTGENVEAVTALPTPPPVTESQPLASEPDAAVERMGNANCSVEPHLDFFGHPNFNTLQSLMGCAVAEPIFESVAINEFGEGPEFNRFMLWTSIDGMIYVLRPDSGWELHADTWRADLPEIACNPQNLEMASPPLPRRGFGKLWCEVASLQQSMGTIAKEERLCQHAVLQQFERGQLLACFEDATYRYFRIMDDQTWESVFIQ